MSLKRILVTGGAGFLGSHLCERLVAEGHDVICLDNFFTSQKSNVAHLLGQANFELVRHDITQPMWLEVDEIYNLACPAAPGHYQYNPIKTMKTSVLGAIHVLGMAKRCRAKVLQASTSEVYGDPEVHPQPESYRGAVNPIGPRACYDEGKRAAETLFMDYHRSNRVNVRVIRIFNTYGPRMHPFDGRVVSNFIRQALQGEDITIFGEGNQTRSFCYRDDLVEGMIRMMNGPDDFIGPVNIGNPGESAGYNLGERETRLDAHRAAARRIAEDHRLVPLHRHPALPRADAQLLRAGAEVSESIRVSRAGETMYLHIHSFVAGLLSFGCLFVLAPHWLWGLIGCALSLVTDLGQFIDQLHDESRSVALRYGYTAVVQTFIMFALFVVLRLLFFGT